MNDVKKRQNTANKAEKLLAQGEDKQTVANLCGYKSVSAMMHAVALHQSEQQADVHLQAAAVQQTAQAAASEPHAVRPWWRRRCGEKRLVPAELKLAENVHFRIKKLTDPHAVLLTRRACMGSAVLIYLNELQELEDMLERFAEDLWQILAEAKQSGHQGTRQTGNMRDGRTVWYVPQEDRLEESAHFRIKRIAAPDAFLLTRRAREGNVIRFNVNELCMIMELLVETMKRLKEVQA